MFFEDRVEAGRKLAEKLLQWDFSGGLVLAIPRGGVVVGAEVARRLKIDLDLIIPRKIGAPQDPEVAVGAVTQDGTTIFDQRLLRYLGLSEQDFSENVAHVMEEIKRRMETYRKTSDFPDVSGKKIIVVDDGVATGYTMLAALRSLKKYDPLEVTLAVPVSPPDNLEMLGEEVDRTVCLLAPAEFYAVGQFYSNFEQTGDEEVIRILEEFGAARA